MLMTREEAVAEQWRLFPNGDTLPEICLALRASLNGAADPWPEEAIRDTVAMLQARAKTWDHKMLRWRGVRLDNAVLEMVRATIELSSIT